MSDHTVSLTAEQAADQIRNVAELIDGYKDACRGGAVMYPGDFAHDGERLRVALNALLADRSARGEEVERLRAREATLAAALSRALDILDMQTKRLVDLGDPRELAYSPTYVAATSKARSGPAGWRLP